jgi:hypothetical protein
MHTMKTYLNLAALGARGMIASVFRFADSIIKSAIN